MQAEVRVVIIGSVSYENQIASSQRHTMLQDGQHLSHHRDECTMSDETIHSKEKYAGSIQRPINMPNEQAQVVPMIVITQIMESCSMYQAGIFSSLLIISLLEMYDFDIWMYLYHSQDGARGSLCPKISQSLLHGQQHSGIQITIASFSEISMVIQMLSMR